MIPIKFMNQRYTTMVLSAVLLFVAILSLAVNQLNWGLDFTGGTLVEVNYQEVTDLQSIRKSLERGGYFGASVVSFGTDKDVLIRLPAQFSDSDAAQILSLLRAESSTSIDLRRIEFVGPQVGDELRDQGGLAMLLALALVMLYVTFRFQYKFAVGALAALVHDVLIVLGFFSILRIEFDLTVLAALLAVIGYSLNDTIVVSDRIRENFRKIRKVKPVDVINISLTETLGRTLVTSLTTTFVLISLALLGGEMIHGFSIALLVGVLTGTYSSIYVSANTLLALEVSQEDLMIPVKEGADQQEIMP